MKLQEETSFLKPRLEVLPLFAGMDSAALDAFADEMEWFDVPGGMMVLAEHEPADAMYVVVGGLLGFIRGGVIESEAHKGDLVGVIGLFTGKPHTANVIALRDSSLLRISKAAFDRLLLIHPQALTHVTTEIIDWLRRPRLSPLMVPPRTIAVLPLGDVPAARVAHMLAEIFVTSGYRAILLDAAMDGKTEREFDAIETAYERVVYCGDSEGSSWSRLCLRRADHVLLIADAAAVPQRPALLVNMENASWRHFDLVLLQAPERKLPLPAAPWLAAVPARFHFHLRLGHGEDIARLQRMLTGHAVGLVLSGGGARAYGHLGAAYALREAGIPFDLLGGTSMGAIIAAGLAHEWSDAELRDRMMQAFVTTSPLDDYALPFVALTKGRKVSARLKEHFGDHRIEDLWRPYFAVSANLTTGRPQLHESGLLWRVLRASVAIPGLLPAVIEQGEVLVDGAVMNNLPTDMMRQWGRGPVIGVDVGRRENFRAVRRGPLSRLLLGEDAAAPSIANVLLRAGTVGSEAVTDLARGGVDLLIEPQLPGISIRDWKEFDRTIEAGYRHTLEQLARTDLTRFKR